MHAKVFALWLKVRRKTAMTRAYLQDLRIREREQQRYLTACQKLVILSSSAITGLLFDICNLSGPLASCLPLFMAFFVARTHGRTDVRRFQYAVRRS